MDSKEAFNKWHSAVYGGESAHTDTELKELRAVWKAAIAWKDSTEKVIFNVTDRRGYETRQEAIDWTWDFYYYEKEN